MGYIFGPEAIEDLTPETIAKIRQEAKDKSIDAFLLLRLRRYLLPTRVSLAIERAYHQKLVMKPVEDYTDGDFLSIRNIGPKSLVEIRKILPPPGEPQSGLTREDIVVRELGGESRTVE